MGRGGPSGAPAGRGEWEMRGLVKFEMKHCDLGEHVASSGLQEIVLFENRGLSPPSSGNCIGIISSS